MGDPGQESGGNAQGNGNPQNQSTVRPRYVAYAPKHMSLIKPQHAAVANAIVGY